MTKRFTDTWITITGARMHNLKNLTVRIPRNKLVVVTGVSGSGKSSLVFDTLYAEGHRRYVESLSSYARQFLARLPKPDVDSITGLSPAIAIEQKVSTSNPRSTVGSVTEVYDYLRLLFARIGRTYSPVTGQEVVCHTVSDVVDAIAALPVGARALLLAPFRRTEGRPLGKELAITIQRGFTRLFDNGTVLEIEDLLDQTEQYENRTLQLLIDRFVGQEYTDPLDRETALHAAADSAQTAFNEGHGECCLWYDAQNIHYFSERFEADGIVFEKPTEALFNFNTPLGACPTCEGFGRIVGISPELVIPNPGRSVFDQGVRIWENALGESHRRAFIKAAKELNFPVHRPIRDLTPAELDFLWSGDENHAVGIHAFIRFLEKNLVDVAVRVLYSRFRGYTTCPDCGGTRLRREARYVRIQGRSLGELLDLPIRDALPILQEMATAEAGNKAATRLFTEIINRLTYLNNVGVGYLTISRKANTLSGGETQRINLATSLGGSLVGSMYILDEPSVGLHPRDGDRLLGVLERLRDAGNTVIVVEHDEDTMRRADYLIDMGPLAGAQGGQVLAAGTVEEVLQNTDSLTARYLTGNLTIPVPRYRRSLTRYVEITGASEHNLKAIDVKIPLGGLVVITGVSGSGKTTLVKRIAYARLAREFDRAYPVVGAHEALNYDPEMIEDVQLIDQFCIGKNERSNAATYVGAYDALRELMATLPAAKQRSLKSSHFSFNVPGGRCDTCEGEGYITVEMQFLPDVKIECETCRGKRFKDVVLEVRYEGLNMYEILNLTVDQAAERFKDHRKISTRLQPLQAVGLGYLTLGQSTSTLSGGELQRLKLAEFLKDTKAAKTLFIFDEPTTGLHLHDVQLIVQIFQRLITNGHSVWVIEHHLDVIKCADWVIDLGPEGGDRGGQVVAQGTPEDLANQPTSVTGHYLRSRLSVLSAK